VAKDKVGATIIFVLFGHQRARNILRVPVTYTAVQNIIASYRIGIKDAGLKPLCSPLYNILQYNWSILAHTSVSGSGNIMSKVQVHFLITQKNIQFILKTIYSTWINNLRRQAIPNKTHFRISCLTRTLIINLQTELPIFRRHHTWPTWLYSCVDTSLDMESSERKIRSFIFKTYARERTALKRVVKWHKK